MSDDGFVLTEGLTGMQQAWADEYVEMWPRTNGTEAARRAGYKGSDNVLAGIGYRNLRHPKIRTYIQAKLEANLLTKAETLTLLDRMARGEEPTRIHKQAYSRDRKEFDRLSALKEILHRYGFTMEVARKEPEKITFTVTYDDDRDPRSPE